jgi:uncharacterized protein YdbL (DUF1318 family)
MTTTIQTTLEELDETFIQKLKTTFSHVKNQQVTIVIGEIKVQFQVGSELDETEYLMSTEANRQFLMESIEQARRGELIELTSEELAKHFSK